MSEIRKHIWQAIKLKFKDEFYRRSGIQYITNDVSVEETESEERPEDTLGDLELVCDGEMLPSTELCKDSEENIFPALLKIIIFFYQVNILFKIYSGSKSHGFAHVLEEIVSTLFNLQINGAFTQELFWCPFHNLKPVTKILLKGSFTVYLFLLICLAYVLSRTRKLFHSTIAGLNDSRLICCTVRLIFISYAGITASFFSLLSCVHLGHLGKVLFVDGSIRCYKWWQVLVICVICCWTIPFPAIISTTSQFLHKNMLSIKQFLICLLFPLPAIMYWLYDRFKNDWKKFEHTEMPNQVEQDVLQITEGPFRKLNVNTNEDNAYRLPWETVLIGRRLVLIVIKTFVINTFHQLCLMLFLMNLFMVHHIYAKPFSNNSLNKTETISLSMLSIICFLNLIPAYNYSYPI